MSDREALHALADRLGILARYIDATGSEQETSDANREAIARAMGWEAASEAEARASLEALERRERERLIDPAIVVTGKERSDPGLRVRLPEGAEQRIAWELDVGDERGAVRREMGVGTPLDGMLEIEIPRPGEIGYYPLRLRLELPDGERVADSHLVVAPATCYTVRQAIGRRRVFGIWSNLYALRGADDWGIGDLGDLAALARWAGEAGADFLGVNPLHALWNRGGEVSPYSPVSRLFRNPIYVDIAAVPELAESDEARALLDDPALAAEREALHGSDQVDYERVWALKRRVLEALHRTFRERHEGTDDARGRAYDEYRMREGDALRDFATFLAIDESVTAERGAPQWFREWPEGWRRPDAAEVDRLRSEHAEAVDFHRWLQFELDRQLGLAAAAARDAGMRIGLYQDLAVGTSGGGSDLWAYQDLFCSGATIGAPPDPFAAQGQDWGLPPLDPNRLAADGFRYWIRLVRSAMRHAGALRIDHAMGLQRLYWIPSDRSPTEGAYVRYPERELLAILALESRRHEALVVAEDLGTVPPGFERTLARWGILSSKLMYFEHEQGQGFKPASRYSARALVTTTTHDHAPLAAWWGAEDIALREELGVLGEPGEDARGRRDRERWDLVHRLREDGHLPTGSEELPDYPTVLRAAHRFLADTPAPLLGLSLEDLTGETTPVNVPGVGPDRYPVWRRRVRLPVEALGHDETVRAGVEGAAARGGDIEHEPHDGHDEYDAGLADHDTD